LNDWSTSKHSSWPKPIVAWYSVGVLLLAFLFSAIDRVIMGLLLTPIKDDLGLSDAALGALLGIAFATAFTVTGLLAGWLADRISRRGIIGVAIGFWSLATAACGLTTNFAQMLLGRTMVAAGESALSPAAFSLISDSFPSEKLGRALAIYMSGAFFGAGISLLVGGALLSFLEDAGAFSLPMVGLLKPWQLVFFIVGMPGLLVALLMLTVREPIRRGVTRAGSRKTTVFKYMRNYARFYCSHLIGFSFMAGIIVVILTWAPTIFVRYHGLTTSEVGFQLGMILLVFTPLGVYSGGWLVDSLVKAGHSDGSFIVGVIAALGSLPFVIAANTVSDSSLAMALYCPLVFFATLAVACGPTAIQVSTPNEFRAQISAGYLMTLNIITSLFGATGVGFLTDYLFRDELAVGKSVALTCVFCGLCAASLLWYGRPYLRAKALESRRPPS
jgi:MFS family permease